MSRFRTAASAQGAEDDSRYVYDSRGLLLIRRKLEQKPGLSVLELGPALNANISFFLEFHCKLIMQDLYGGLCDHIARNQEGEPSPISALVGKLSEHDPARPFDLVLCWDLLNYISSEETELLMTSIAERSSESVIISVVEANSSTLPVLPSRFRILEGQKIEIEKRTTEQRQKVFRSQETITRPFPGITLQSSLRLKNGFMEQVYCRG